MQASRDGWRWTNGLAQARPHDAAFGLAGPRQGHRRASPLAPHLAEGLCGLQQPCGAVREELGLPGQRMLRRAVNRHYGFSESPLIQENGDTICDLLYTSNFALLGLHEAAAATGDAFYTDMEDKLMRFLCRIQITSQAHAGTGWRLVSRLRLRPLGILGQQQRSGLGRVVYRKRLDPGWITSVLAMRQLEDLALGYGSQSRIEKDFNALRRQMLPDAVLAGPTGE